MLLALAARPTMASRPRPSCSVATSVQVVPSKAQVSARSCAPPPGWYIRSHSIVCTKKEGLASYTVTTVPAHWVSTAEETSSSIGKATGDVDAALNAFKTVKAKISGSKEQAATEKQSQSFSHHALVVEAVVQGGGWLRSGVGTGCTPR